MTVERVVNTKEGWEIVPGKQIDPILADILSVENPSYAPFHNLIIEKVQVIEKSGDKRAVYLFLDFDNASYSTGHTPRGKTVLYLYNVQEDD